MKIKRTLITIITLSLSLAGLGQDITGQWNGLLPIPGSPLRLTINITKTDNGFTSTLDSPDQGAFGILVDSTSFENTTLKIIAAVLIVLIIHLLVFIIVMNKKLKKAKD